MAHVEFQNTLPLLLACQLVLSGVSVAQLVHHCASNFGLGWAYRLIVKPKPGPSEKCQGRAWARSHPP